MKDKKMIPRPMQAFIASVLILSSIPLESHGQITLSLILIFLGSFIFGHILQSIKMERNSE
ncbi:MAG: hypothetical protein ACKO7P_13090 [Bacteroidota bacterium]|jgi:hypothetical protein